MKYVLMTVTMMTLAGPALAQTADRWRLEITGAASSAYDFTTASCNQAPPAIGSTVNPNLIIWDDPSNAGRVCLHDTGVGTGPLFALPIGAYTATLRAGNAAGYSNPSNSASFTRLAPPTAAPTGLRFGNTGS